MSFSFRLSKTLHKCCRHYYLFLPSLHSGFHPHQASENVLFKVTNGLNISKSVINSWVLSYLAYQQHLTTDYCFPLETCFSLINFQVTTSFVLPPTSLPLLGFLSLFFAPPQTFKLQWSVVLPSFFILYSYCLGNHFQLHNFVYFFFTHDPQLYFTSLDLITELQTCRCNSLLDLTTWIYNWRFKVTWQEIELLSHPSPPP